MIIILIVWRHKIGLASHSRQKLSHAIFVMNLQFILLRVIPRLSFACHFKGPSTLATLFNHMWPRIVAGIFIPVGNHYFQALASTLQFVAQVCDRLWLVPATDRAFAYITYMSPPHVALVCSGPPQKRGHMWLNKVDSVLWPLKASTNIE